MPDFICSPKALFSLNSSARARGLPLDVAHGWAVEWDAACQKILGATYGVCCAPDVMTWKPEAAQHECATHMCKCPMTHDAKRSLASPAVF
jgi:hypothetical protein